MTVSKLENLKKRWKDIFTCMNCGDCGYAIRPAVGRFLTCPIKEAKGEEGFEIYFSRGRMNVLKSVLEGKLPLSRKLAEFAYQCSECGNCSEVCHQSQNEYIVHNTSKWIDHVEVWNALRMDLVEGGYSPLQRHKDLISYMRDEAMKNPYGEPKEKKLEWASQFSIIKEKADLAFFHGCTIPLKQSETLKNLMKILKAAGKEIAISKDEWCCGSIAIRIGDEKTAIETLKHNLEEIKKTEAKIVFTACAGCYRTLKKDYPNLIGEELPFEVKHVTELLNEMLINNEIPFKEVTGEEIIVTYHDPCHLGRHMGVYDIPRTIISKIPGVVFVEMKRNRNNGWCCGAGGGVKSQFPELALTIAKDRLHEAIKTEANILLTSCPFCVSNLNDAREDGGLVVHEKIKVLDLIDFIASKIE